MPNLEHERAIYAHRCVTAVNDPTQTPDQDDKIKKGYRSLINAAGPLIHQAGLFQTLGFYLQKWKPQSSNPSKQHFILLEHILRWLFRDGIGNVSVPDLYFLHLLGICEDPGIRGVNDYQARAFTAETQALVLWLKRFAVALLPDPDQEGD